MQANTDLADEVGGLCKREGDLFDILPLRLVVHVSAHVLCHLPTMK